MKKTFILCLFFSAILPAQAVSLNTIKERYTQSNEAIKKIFPAFSKAEDPLHRGIPGYNIEIKPEMMQFWTGFLAEHLTICIATLFLNLVETSHVKAAICVSLLACSTFPAITWGTSKTTGKYLACGATTAATLGVLVATAGYYAQ